MRDLDELFGALSRSQFRRRQRLRQDDAAYLTRRGLEKVMRHAEVFVRRRLAPEKPRNDGRQTPMRGHPVFVAQHATATCCRGCLWRWHRIGKERPLSEAEIAYVLRVLRRWLADRLDEAAACDSLPTRPRQRRLFDDPQSD